MPWLSIISFIVTFLLSKSQGASTGKAAMLATAAGLATYYVADPANPDNLLGFGQTEKTTPGTVDEDTGASAPTGGGGLAGTIGGIAKTGVSEVGSTMRSWGPTGTLGVAAGVTALSSDSFSKYLPWIAGGLVLILLTR